MANRIDYGKLRDFEGFDLRGHVPEAGRSGVTVGMGIDLGQRNEQDLRRAGLSPMEYDRLLPFLGRERDDAQKALDCFKYLYGKDFEIAEDTWRKLRDDYVALRIDPMIRRYNASLAPGRLRFDQLPTEIQTVIASVTWQYGTPAAKTPAFWAHVVDQDWDAALSELRNFRDAYQTRHTQEAFLMEAGVNRLRQDGRP
ncbi:MAG: pesticin C-terminus-like muramidase [Alphaproteobacteria bacterium]|nr:pesticin C-terminus-like muramidase [Alphaproteobacteria bacterium]